MDYLLSRLGKEDLVAKQAKQIAAEAASSSSKEKDKDTAAAKAKAKQ
jgi:hypothetical protein